MALEAALAACRTTADFYRVQIDAENLMTPLEVTALAARAEALPEPARPWIERLDGLVRRVRPEPEPFRRREIAPHVQLYEGTGEPRDLVIGLTGVALRLMMPAAPVLQAFDASRCDVLVLADADRTCFLSGLAGYAEGPEAAARRLAQDLPLSRYAAVRTFGTSAGGAAALAYGAQLGARVALSLGGSHPFTLSPRRANGQVLDRRVFDRMIASARPGATRLFCVFAEMHARDAVRTRLQAIGLPGARAVSVTGVPHHGVITGLFHGNALVRFFDEWLFAETTPEGRDWAP
jgi:hypothetical protein